MNVNEFLATLNPKIAKTFKTASETETVLLPTASKRLNRALGGGFGKGRITLLYGNTSSGKSALVQQSIGQWQKDGLMCAYVDVEGTWDNAWTERLGVDNDNLILLQKKSTEGVHDSIIPLIQGGVDVIVIDSISMMLPAVFIDDDGNTKNLDGHKQIGAMSKGMTAMVNSIHYSNDNTAIILISQTTTDINSYGSPQKPTGGERVKFASTQIVRLNSTATENGQIKGDVAIGEDLTLQKNIGRKVGGVVEKNKVGPPNGRIDYDFYYDGDFVGVDYVGEIFDDAVKYQIVKKGGAWFTFGETRWQGRPAAISALREDNTLLEQMEYQVEELLK